MPKETKGLSPVGNTELPVALISPSVSGDDVSERKCSKTLAISRKLTPNNKTLEKKPLCLAGRPRVPQTDCATTACRYRAGFGASATEAAARATPIHDKSGMLFKDLATPLSLGP